LIINNFKSTHQHRRAPGIEIFIGEQLFEDLLPGFFAMHQPDLRLPRNHDALPEHNSLQER